MWVRNVMTLICIGPSALIDRIAHNTHGVAMGWPCFAGGFAKAQYVVRPSAFHSFVAEMNS